MSDGFDRGRSAISARRVSRTEPIRQRSYLEPLEPRILLSADIGLVPDALLALPSDPVDPRLLVVPEVHDDLLVREPSRFEEIARDVLRNVENGKAGETSGVDTAAFTRTPTLPAADGAGIDPAAPVEATDPTAEVESADPDAAARALRTRVWRAELAERFAVSNPPEQIVIVDAGIPQVDSLLEAVLDGIGRPEGTRAESSSSGDLGIGESESPALAASTLPERSNASVSWAFETDSGRAEAAFDRSRAEVLAEALEDRGVAVVVLDPGRDGLDQLVEIAFAYQGVAAMHVVSHGSRGSLVLGNSRVTTDTLRARSGLLAGLRDALGPEGDLLLYGCEVAAGEVGIEFVSTLAELGGIDVAASTDLTGAAVYGGDWDLEYAVGEIVTPAIMANAFSGVLGGFSVVEAQANAATLTISYDVAGGSWNLSSQGATLEDALTATQATSFDIAANETLTITLGDLADTVELVLDGSGAPTAFTAAIQLFGGDGGDSLTLSGSGAGFSGPILLSGGLGEDSLVLAPFTGTDSTQIRFSGDQAADNLSFEGFEAPTAARLVLAGGVASDTYSILREMQDAGRLTIEEGVAGGVADRLLYPTGFTEFASGSLTLVDEANIETIGVGLDGEAIRTSIEEGLARLTAWADRLQTEGDLATALAGIRGNVDVSLGAALDLGQAFDQLRVLVEAADLADFETGEALRALFGGLDASSIEHDDRSVFGSVYGSAALDVANFGLRIQLDEEEELRFGSAASTGDLPIDLTIGIQLDEAKLGRDGGRIPGLQLELSNTSDTRGTLTRESGSASWQDEGFELGQTIELTAGRDGVNRATGRFEILEITEFTLTLGLPEGADRDAFERIIGGESGSYDTTPDTAALDIPAIGSLLKIRTEPNGDGTLRRDWGSFADDGFRKGQTLVLADPDGNVGEFEIQSVSGDGRLLTLDVSDQNQMIFDSIDGDDGEALGTVSGLSIRVMNTLYRRDGSRFETDGFRVDQDIEFRPGGAVSKGRIAEISEDGRILTIDWQGAAPALAVAKGVLVGRSISSTSADTLVELAKNLNDAIATSELQGRIEVVVSDLAHDSATATSRLGFRVLDTEVDRLTKLSLSSDDPAFLAALGFENEISTEGLAGQLGGLGALDVATGSVDLSVDAQAGTFSLGFVYSANRSNSFNLSFGEVADGLGIAPESSASVDLRSEMSSQLTLILGLDPTAPSFDVSITALNVSARTDTTQGSTLSAGTEINVGFLGAQVGRDQTGGVPIGDGRIDLDAALSLIDLAATPAALARWTNIDLGAQDLRSLATDLERTATRFEVDVPLVVKPGLDVAGTEPFPKSPLAIKTAMGAVADVFDGSSALVDDRRDTAGSRDDFKNFAEVESFANLDALGFIRLLGQIRTGLARLGQSELIDSFDVPLIGSTLSEVVDIADAFGDALLFDDGDDGRDRDDDTILVTDLNRALTDVGLSDFVEFRVIDEGTKFELFAKDPRVESLSILNATGQTIGLSDEFLGFLDQTLTSAGGQELKLTANSGVDTFNDPTATDMARVAMARRGRLEAAHSATIEVVLRGRPAISRQLSLDADTTAGNEKVGNDVAKLLDTDNVPTFRTAQELKSRLESLAVVAANEAAGGGGSADGPISFRDNTLFYKLEFSNEILSEELDIDFDLDLGPLADVQTTGNPRLQIGGDVGFEITFGVDLNAQPNGQGRISGSTKLEDLRGIDVLGDLIKTNPAITARNTPGPVEIDDATIDIGLDRVRMSGNPALVFEGSSAFEVSVDTISGTSAFLNGPAGQRLFVGNAEGTLWTSTSGRQAILSVPSMRPPVENGDPYSTDAIEFRLFLPDLNFSGTPIASDGFLVSVAAQTFNVSSSLSAKRRWQGVIENAILTAQNDAVANTILRTDKSWRADGFAAGQIIEISGSQSNQGRYEILSLSGMRLTVVEDLVPSVKGRAERGILIEGPGTITVSDPTRLVDFGPGDVIRIAGSLRNDGVYVVDSADLARGLLTLTNALDPEPTSKTIVVTDSGASLKLSVANQDAASFELEIEGQTYSVVLAAVADAEDPLAPNTDDNQSLSDLVQDLRLALSSAVAIDDSGSPIQVNGEDMLLGQRIDVGLDGNRLVLTYRTGEFRDGVDLAFSANGTMTRTATGDGAPAGSWTDDGFREGSLFRISDSRIAAHDGLYRILSIEDPLAGGEAGTVARVERVDSTLPILDSTGESDLKLAGTVAAYASGAADVRFTNSGITKPAGSGSFEEDGFRRGDLVVIESAGDRNGSYEISGFSNMGLTMELAGLVGSDTLATGVLLSSSFRIGDLNAKAQGLGFGGVTDATEQAANLHDLVIQTGDGSEFFVSLDGATTVGDVIARINEAAVGSAGDPNLSRVLARINEQGTGLELVERGQLTGSPRLTFAEAPIDAKIIRSEGNWRDDGFGATPSGGGSLTFDIVGTVSNEMGFGVERIEDGVDGEGTVLVLDPSTGANVTAEDFVRQATIEINGFDPGAEDFEVSLINGSSAAFGLGILRADAEADSNGDGQIDYRDGDGVIEGSAIGGPTLFDRLFIMDPRLTASLSIEPVDEDGIDVSGRFGFFEADLNADGKLFAEASITLNEPGAEADKDGRITLREIANGLQDIREFIDVPRFGGNRLDEAAGTITFGNATVDGALRGRIQRTGNWPADAFVVGQRVTIRGSSGFDGDYTIEGFQDVDGNPVRIGEPGVDPDTAAIVVVSGAEDGSAVFSSLAAGATGTRDAIGDLEIVAAIGTLNLQLTKAGLAGFEGFAGFSADTPEDQLGKVVLTLFDFGDPFYKEVLGPESKAGGDAAFAGFDTLSIADAEGQEAILRDLARTLADRFEVEVEVVYTDAEGNNEKTVSGKVAQIDVATGRVVATEDLVETVDNVRVQSVRFTKPPRTEVATPDLGNLLDFQDISIRDIIRGLRLASDFLGQFEEFGFLDEKIPVLDASFNDLLSYADELAIAVEALAQDRQGSLQTLESRLEEVLGIDDGVDPAAGQDPFDIELIYATEELSGASAGETKGILRIDLIVGSSFRDSMNVEFDLGAGEVLAGAAGLNVDAEAEIRIALGIDISATELRGAPDLIFTNVGERGRLQRLETDPTFSWLDDGFLPGQTLDIRGSGANDGRYVIFDIVDAGKTLVLTEALPDGMQAVRVSGVEVTGSRAISLFDDTAITADLSAGATDIDFRAAVGPLGIFIKDGSVDLAAVPASGITGSDGSPVVFRAGLDLSRGDQIFAAGVAESNPYERQLLTHLLARDAADELNLSNAFDARLAAQLALSLPVYFPTDSNLRGRVDYSFGLTASPAGGLDIDEVSNGNGLRFFDADRVQVDFEDLFNLADLINLGQLSLFDNILLAVDGLDLFLGGVQDLLDGEVFGIELPLIGDSLADGARFIGDLRDDFVEPLREGIEDAESFTDDLGDANKNVLSKLLFDLLAPTGLLRVTQDADGRDLDEDQIFTATASGLVTDPSEATARDRLATTESKLFLLSQVIRLNGTRRNDENEYFTDEAQTIRVTDGEIDIADIPVDFIQDIAFLEWDFRLGQTASVVDSDIALDFGLPALGLEADGAVGLELAWDLELGFGLDFQQGFYFDVSSADELEVDVDVVLPESLTGRLAFLQLDAIDAGSRLGASFSIDVVNGDDPGDDKLSFVELGKLKLETGLVAEANALLDLQLRLNEDLLADFSNVFPTVNAGFEFDWGIGIRGGVLLDFDASSQGVGTIRRSDGVDWAAESFMVGQKIRISGTTSAENDGAYVIQRVDGDELVVELAGSQSFSALSDQADVTIRVDLSSLNGSLLSDGLRLVEFRNIELDLGSFINDFISPVLGEIQNVTGPIQPIVDLLTAPLPVISDLGPPVTLLDLARSTGFLNPGLIEAIADIITLVNAIPTDVAEIVIPFGSFTIFDRTGNEMSVDPTDPNADLSGMSDRAAARSNSDVDADLEREASKGGRNKKSADFVSRLKNTKGFQIPILTDPSQIFGLLTGQEVTLFGYDLAPLEFDFTAVAFFPIFGPLGVGVQTTASARIDFAFGFDSSGLQRFFDSGFSNPELIFDGFFVSDNPENVTGEGPDLNELEFDLGLALTAELNLGVARAGVAGGINARINFDLFDPNRDGKIRVGEILSNVENEFLFGEPLISPLAIFDVSGKITARAFAFLKINLLLVTIDKEFNITPPVTLVDFDIDFTRVPKLATELDDGTLQLNLGEFSEQRLNGDLNDLAEKFVVVSEGEGLRVTWLDSNPGGRDFTQIYKGSFKRILAMGGAGNDLIDVSGVDQAGIRFDLEGGAGDDILNAGSTAAGVRARLRGGEGKDRLIGSAGDDLLFGGSGRDVILGGAGNDVLFGDSGRLVERDPRIRKLALALEAAETNVSPTTITRSDEGSFVDDGFAAGQMLEIKEVDENGETILEGVYLIEGLTDGEMILVSDATSALAPTATGPVPVASTGNRTTSNLIIKALDARFLGSYQIRASDSDGDDFVSGGGGDDLIFGGGGADELVAGAGDDLVLGDGGVVRLNRDREILEIADTDRGRVFAGDSIRGDAGEDRLFGGRGDDVIRGGDGDDTIYGESGSDRLFGDDANDTLYGGRDGDMIQGGAAADTIYGGQGADRIFGDDDDDSDTTGDGNDILRGQAGSDEIHGGGGADDLSGGGDPDLLFGGEGRDTLRGDAGDDVVRGDEGNDEIIVRGGSDRVDGGEGSDDYLVKYKGGENSARVSVEDTGTGVNDVDDLRIDGTAGEDQFLLRASTQSSGKAFVASINRGNDVERVDYAGVENLIVNGGAGDDSFALDDIRALATLNGGGGDDFFQVGQLYRSARTTEAGNIALEDQFTTTETTRGFVSNGVSESTTINGGNDNDRIIVFRNLGTLSVNGQAGDDTVEVRAFALVNDLDRLQKETTISGGEGADTIRYAVNAPVNIDGGDGLDSVSVIGTEFADEFVITRDGVFGAGLNVNFVNVELLRVDGAEGDDRFYIQSTNESILTQVVGGLGSDTFQIADGVERAVTSNDLLGHSGLILHDVESEDPIFQGPEGNGIAVDGISANIADADEPGIVISQSEGFTRVAEGGVLDWYTVVLARRPEAAVRVVVSAPRLSPEEERLGEATLDVWRDDGSDSGGPDRTSEGDSLVLVFDSSNWFEAQTVWVEASSDVAPEGERFGIIQHKVEVQSGEVSGSDITAVSAPGLASDGSVIRDADGDLVTTIDLAAELTTDYTLVGRLFEIVGPPAGQVSGGLGQSLLVKSSESVVVDGRTFTRLRLFGVFNQEDSPLAGSEYRIRFYDGLQARTVSVQIDDNDAADVILRELEDLRVFEDGNEDADVIDRFGRYTVELSRDLRGSGPLRVALDVVDANGEGPQVELSSVAPDLASESDWMTTLTLSFADADETQTIYVRAKADAVREGFHRGLIAHRVLEETSRDSADRDIDEFRRVTEPDIRLPEDVEKADSILLENRPLQFRGNVDPANPEDSNRATTIAGFGDVEFSVADLARLLAEQGIRGDELRMWNLRITHGTGAGQVRRVESIVENTVTVASAWEIVPDETSRFSISGVRVVLTLAEGASVELDADRFELNGNTLVFLDAEAAVEERAFESASVSYAYVDRGYEGRVEERISIQVIDGDTAGVLVLESDFSTDLIEVNGGVGPEQAVDNYQIVLSRPPAAGTTVEVFVDPAPTLTTRGALIRGTRVDSGEPHVGEVQVEVRAGANANAEIRDGRLVLVFDDTNWNRPQTVEVTAIADGLVDGGDTKVFAPRLRTLTEIQGPLLIDGAGGRSSLEGLTPPVLLPNEDEALRETNVKQPTGNILDGEERSELELAIRVDRAGLDAYLDGSDVSVLIGKTFEIVRGAGLDQFREILGVEDNANDYTLILSTALATPTWELDVSEFAAESAYRITRQSLNFFVNEAEQQDLVFVHDEDSPADSSGRMTALDYAEFPEMESFYNGRLDPSDENFLVPDRLVGFGMGPDSNIARGLRPGGISYSNFEGFELDLGFGNNSLSIDAVHDRDDGTRTFTRIRTGRGNDVVLVSAENPSDPGTGVPWVEIDTGLGDDFVDASSSTLPLQIVGGFGDDVLIGGQNDDVIHGDFGSLGFEVVDRRAIARTPVESLAIGEGGNDRIEGRAGDDQLFGGAGDDIVRGQEGRDILFGDYGKVTEINALDQIVETTGFFTGGADFIDGGRGNDFLFGGAGRDSLVGSFEVDLIIGEYARLSVRGGVATSIVTLAQGSLDVAASSFFALYDPRFGPFAIFVLPEQASVSQALPTPRPVDETLAPSLPTLGSPTGLRPPVVYQVAEGDTLWDIAGRELNDPYRWTEIYRLSHDSIADPDHIEPRDRIRLPGRVHPVEAIGSGRLAVSELRDQLEELDATSAAEAGTAWRFFNPMAVGAGPPDDAENERTPASPMEAPPEDSLPPEETTSGDAGAMNLGDDPLDPEMSALIWSSLVGWRAGSNPSSARRREKWLRFDEREGRFT